MLPPPQAMGYSSKTPPSGAGTPARSNINPTPTPSLSHPVYNNPVYRDLRSSYFPPGFAPKKFGPGPPAPARPPATDVLRPQEVPTSPPRRGATELSRGTYKTSGPTPLRKFGPTPLKEFGPTPLKKFGPTPLFSNLAEAAPNPEAAAGVSHSQHRRRARQTPTDSTTTCDSVRDYVDSPAEWDSINTEYQHKLQLLDDGYKRQLYLGHHFRSPYQSHAERRDSTALTRSIRHEYAALQETLLHQELHAQQRHSEIDRFRDDYQYECCR